MRGGQGAVPRLDLPLESQTLRFPTFWLFRTPRRERCVPLECGARFCRNRLRTRVGRTSRRGSRTSPNLGKRSVWLLRGRSKRRSHSSPAAALPDGAAQTLRTTHFRRPGGGPGRKSSGKTAFVVNLAHPGRIFYRVVLARPVGFGDAGARFHLKTRRLFKKFSAHF